MKAFEFVGATFLSRSGRGKNAPPTRGEHNVVG
jgi:hypothetical protein